MSGAIETRAEHEVARVLAIADALERVAVDFGHLAGVVGACVEEFGHGCVTVTNGCRGPMIYVHRRFLPEGAAGEATAFEIIRRLKLALPDDSRWTESEVDDVLRYDVDDYLEREAGPYAHVEVALTIYHDRRH